MNERTARRARAPGFVVWSVVVCSVVVCSVVVCSVLAGCSTTETIQKDSASKDGGKNGGGDPAGGVGGGPVSGTRLKARWLAAEDGARHFQGWHDSERDEDCFFDRAADGKMRCLPTSAAINGSWYGDAACTKPLAYASKGCVAPKTAALRETYCANGGGPTKIFAVQGAYRGASLWTKSSNGCTSTPAANFYDNYDLYAIGAEVPASDLVAADETTE